MAITVGFIRAIGIVVSRLFPKLFKVSPRKRIFEVMARDRIFKVDGRDRTLLADKD